MMTLACRIAYIAEALDIAERNRNHPWIEKWEAELEQLENMLPHGSGLDGVVEIDRSATSSDKITIVFDYHHMDEFGGYQGWSEWRLVVSADLLGLTYDLECVEDCEYRTSDGDEEWTYTASEDDSLMDYFVETFDIALQREVE